MSDFSHILCCISLSENPDEIADYANQIAAKYQARLILVHLTPSSESSPRQTRDDERLAELMDHVCENNRQLFIRYVETHFDGTPIIVFSEGEPEKTLISLTDKYCADLIIIGTSSTRGILGSFINKSSENIIGRSRIPILLIPNELSLECTPEEYL